ncbi:unnamed protein product [Calicophoron daubneyi]|uniref:Uncharacterized protein n=1 Tax=Calicophoron daubneyi TaxID=300641 RepID=A0AAV2TYD9_CALDB
MRLVYGLLFALLLSINSCSCCSALSGCTRFGKQLKQLIANLANADVQLIEKSISSYFDLLLSMVEYTFGGIPEEEIKAGLMRKWLWPALVQDYADWLKTTRFNVLEDLVSLLSEGIRSIRDEYQAVDSAEDDISRLALLGLGLEYCTKYLTRKETETSAEQLIRWIFGFLDSHRKFSERDYLPFSRRLAENIVFLIPGKMTLESEIESGYPRIPNYWKPFLDHVLSRKELIEKRWTEFIRNIEAAGNTTLNFGELGFSNKAYYAGICDSLQNIIHSVSIPYTNSLLTKNNVTMKTVGIFDLNFSGSVVI